MPCLVVWLPIDAISTALKLNLFGWVVVDDRRMLTGAWSLKSSTTHSELHQNPNSFSLAHNNNFLNKTMLCFLTAILILPSLKCPRLGYHTGHYLLSTYRQINSLLQVFAYAPQSRP